MTFLPRILLIGTALLSTLSSLAPNGAKFIKVFLPDGTPITAELALDAASRARGVMFRDRMDEDQGMLFVFEREELSSFWMLNVRFPIDILWVDKDKRIVHIESDVPPCPKEPCPSYPTSKPALYVLELKSGVAVAHKIKLYERLEFVLPRDRTRN